MGHDYHAIDPPLLFSGVEWRVDIYWSCIPLVHHISTAQCYQRSEHEQLSKDARCYCVDLIDCRTALPEQIHKLG